MANLSDLPYFMLTEIARRLKKLEDYVSFRSVSKTMRAAAKQEYFGGLRLRQHTPYMMLSVRDGNDDIREFYSLVEGESIVASVKVPDFKRKKCLECLGWLLVSEVDGSMSLLDPFSCTEIPLPHQNTFPEYYLDAAMDEYGFFEKMVLSSRPDETSDFVLMVIGGARRELAFWRPGDKAWNIIDKYVGSYRDVVYYGGGQFCAIRYPGVVWAFNLSGSDNQIKGRLVTNFMTGNRIPDFVDHSEYKRLYILKTVDDSLLVITRTSPVFGEVDFQVYEVDIVRGTWKEIYSLGCKAVFLGHNSTNSLMPQDFLEQLSKPIIFTSRTIIGTFMQMKMKDKAVAGTAVYIIWKRELSSRFIRESPCSTKFLHPLGLLRVFNAAALPFTHRKMTAYKGICS